MIFIFLAFFLSIFVFAESISTSEGPDSNGLFTEKATLRKPMKRKDLNATFECRIETEAIETTKRFKLRVDLQGKIWRSCCFAKYSNYFFFFLSIII